MLSILGIARHPVKCGALTNRSTTAGAKGGGGAGGGAGAGAGGRAGAGAGAHNMRPEKFARTHPFTFSLLQPFEASLSLRSCATVSAAIHHGTIVTLRKAN